MFALLFRPENSFWVSNKLVFEKTPPYLDDSPLLVKILPAELWVSLFCWNKLVLGTWKSEDLLAEPNIPPAISVFGWKARTSILVPPGPIAIEFPDSCFNDPNKEGWTGSTFVVCSAFVWVGNTNPFFDGSSGEADLGKNIFYLVLGEGPNRAESGFTWEIAGSLICIGFAFDYSAALRFKGWVEVWDKLAGHGFSIFIYWGAVAT